MRTKHKRFRYILAVLKAKKESNDFYPDQSIHGQFNAHVSDELALLIKSWPKYSGTFHYPISTCPTFNPKLEFLLAQKQGNLWNTDSEYGKLNHELVDYIITLINSELS